MDEPPADAVTRFAEAAITFVAGGRGQPLVDAAAQALVDGLDSPTLRVLAGAPRASADEEATELASDVFDELGLDIPARFSTDAYLAAARATAQEYLAGHGALRDAARVLYRAYVSAGYPPELSDFSGLDDLYDMLETRVIAGSVSDADNATAEALQRLCSTTTIDSQLSVADIVRRSFLDGQLRHEEPPP